jgi:SWI/SNF-related matrix-associated actin-dependent regulator 1 of chromatin subfamily A
MKLTYRNNRYETISSYDERVVPKAAGFLWDPSNKVWHTKFWEKAAKLAQFADEYAKVALDLDIPLKAQVVPISVVTATDSTLEIPVPTGLSYFSFQKVAVEFAATKKNALIADDLGIGKTVEAIGIINLDPQVKNVLIVCPASLRINWERELTKWLVRDMSVAIANGKGLPETAVVVINYDILGKHIAALKARKFDLIVLDEAHMIKSRTALRSKLTREIIESQTVECRKVFLTGTPIKNRPVELWNLLNLLDSQTWGNFFGYAKQYCNAKRVHIGRGRWVWDFSGASNLEELQARLRLTLMIRRLKSEVLDLPPKVRQVIEIPENGFKGFIARENQTLQRYTDSIDELRAEVVLAEASDNKAAYDSAVSRLKNETDVAFTEMSKLRHELAVAKVPAIVEHAKLVLESTSKLIIFAHHLDVLAKLTEELAEFNPVKLTGEMSKEARQLSVDSFQTDPSVRVFVGSILAAGVGITLTAASVEIFAELPWVPADLIQAEDRAYRIGTTDKVLVQHLVIDGSLDAKMAKTIVAKQNVIDKALDKPTGFAPVSPFKSDADTEPEIKEKNKSEISVEQVVAISKVLALLSRVCDGAVSLDERGYNRFDSVIGRSLAAVTNLSQGQARLGVKVLRKYKRQIPVDIYETIYGPQKD